MQTGALEIDLHDGSSHAVVDGRPAAVEAGSMNLGNGSFGLSCVVWQLNPLVQVSVDNLLVFNRTADGAVTITAASPHAPVTVIPFDHPAAAQTGAAVAKAGPPATGAAASGTDRGRQGPP